MKIRGAKKIHYDSGPNMTPLVDIVMVILIFLMLAGSFAGAEHYLVSNVPFSKQGAGGAICKSVVRASAIIKLLMHRKFLLLLMIVSAACGFASHSAPAQSKPAGGLDSLSDDALLDELAARGMDSLLERAFVVDK